MSERRPQFLYVFTPGERPDLIRSAEAWTPADEAIAAAHAEYLRDGAIAGTVVLAGRSQDWVGPAIVIIETDDEAAARAFMESDPFVGSGLFGAELHPFNVAFTRD